MPKLLDMSRRRLGALAAAVAFAASGPTLAQTGTTAAPGPYANPAPLDQYRMAKSDEIALARSAAPAPISGHAEVLVLGATGYETAAKGDNGFVCLVERAWASGFDDPGFWNPKMRGPICFNPAAARTVLPTDYLRAKWALAGASRDQMRDRTKAAIAAHEIAAPEVGAMSYMMSKDGYLNDQAGHWHPHLMFFLPRMATKEWGADVEGGAVAGDDSSLEPLTVFFVPVTHWSDGTPSAMKM